MQTEQSLLRFHGISASLLAVRTVVMLAQDCMRNIAMRYNLNRAVVVAQLLLGNDIRIVAMNMAIDTHDALHNTRYGTNIV